MDRPKSDVRDVLGGFLLSGVGLFVAVVAGTQYTIGTLQRMGPGMFPLGLGVILTALGLLIAVPAFFRAGTETRIKVRAPLAVLGSLIVFIGVVPSFGLIPAIVGLVVVSALADPKFSSKSALILSAVLAAMAYGIFILALELPIAAFRIP